MKNRIFAILAAGLMMALPAFTQSTYVSQAGATFFAGQAATATQTATVGIPNKSANGNLQIVTTGITGSPSGCQLAMYSVSAASTTAPAAAEQTPTFTITTGTHAQTVAAVSASDVSTDAIKAVYTCSVYPTAGSLTISFAPITTMAGSAVTITTPAQVTNYSSGSLTVTPSDGTNPIGALVNYGSTPTAVKALSTNTFVTNTVAANVTQVGGSTQSATNPLFVTPTDGTNAIGALVNYGSTPTAVKALSANVYVTNLSTDPCQSPSVAKSSASVAIASASTVQIVALSGTKKIYVCDVNVTAAGTAPTVQLISGTASACGTLDQTFTGAMEPSATVGSLHLGYGGTLATTSAGDELCIVAGGTASVQGLVTFVQQ